MSHPASKSGKCKCESSVNGLQGWDGAGEYSPAGILRVKQLVKRRLNCCQGAKLCPQVTADDSASVKRHLMPPPRQKAVIKKWVYFKTRHPSGGAHAAVHLAWHLHAASAPSQRNIDAHAILDLDTVHAEPASSTGRLLTCNERHTSQTLNKRRQRP